MALVQQTGAAIVAEFEGRHGHAVVDSVVRLMRRAFADDVWRFYREHKDDVLLSKRVLVVSITLRVHHARKLFELIAGPEPTEAL